MTGCREGSMELRGYYPGVIGRIVYLHAIYYHKHWGFDVSFETQVGRELSDFIAAFAQGRDGFWVADAGGEFAGAIAIDGHKSDKEGARLRWFIMDERFQGCGFGKRLLEASLAFCRAACYRRVYLWTFRGLDRARALYEQAGFRLGEEHTVRQWGSSITEQMFLLEPPFWP
jgi:GNAT superfamily N-acetyltransferase